MTVSSLDRVLAFVGSTGSTAISFILPGIFYYRMTRPGGLLPRTPEDNAKDDDDASIHLVLDDGASHESSGSSSSDLSETDSNVAKQRARRKKIRRTFALGLVFYGSIVMAVCLTINIIVGKGGH
jgi:Transmembrane amino acid transporter protein